jgi:hypothetical protein
MMQQEVHIGYVLTGGYSDYSLQTQSSFLNDLKRIRFFLLLPSSRERASGKSNNHERLFHSIEDLPGMISRYHPGFNASERELFFCT